ncbi:MAG: uncharacterized protein KVP18_000083 [Porospora cf. gigantea A]|uniref:uncharacterized protein n=1 Tax=Porospora cf. gigantea A TaxID=2853593 RepID=UPI00355A6372|nr:MAG: hypothetical protein KVP18_000083 [Porospora cf. gigantea A]
MAYVEEATAALHSGRPKTSFPSEDQSLGEVNFIKTLSASISDSLQMVDLLSRATEYMEKRARVRKRVSERFLPVLTFFLQWYYGVSSSWDKGVLLGLLDSDLPIEQLERYLKLIRISEQQYAKHRDMTFVGVVCQSAVGLDPTDAWTQDSLNFSARNLLRFVKLNEGSRPWIRPLDEIHHRLPRLLGSYRKVLSQLRRGSGRFKSVTFEKLAGGLTRFLVVFQGLVEKVEEVKDMCGYWKNQYERRASLLQFLIQEIQSLPHHLYRHLNPLLQGEVTLDDFQRSSLPELERFIQSRPRCHLAVGDGVTVRVGEVQCDLQGVHPDVVEAWSRGAYSLYRVRSRELRYHKPPVRLEAWRALVVNIWPSELETALGDEDSDSYEAQPTLFQEERFPISPDDPFIAMKLRFASRLGRTLPGCFLQYIGELPLETSLNRLVGGGGGCIQQFHDFVRGLVPAATLKDSAVLYSWLTGARIPSNVRSGGVSLGLLFLLTYFQRGDREEVYARLVSVLGHPLRLNLFYWRRTVVDIELLEDIFGLVGLGTKYAAAAFQEMMASATSASIDALAAYLKDCIEDSSEITRILVSDGSDRAFPSVIVTQPGPPPKKRVSSVLVQETLRKKVKVKRAKDNAVEGIHTVNSEYSDSWTPPGRLFVQDSVSKHRDRALTRHTITQVGLSAMTTLRIPQGLRNRLVLAAGFKYFQPGETFFYSGDKRHVYCLIIGAVSLLERGGSVETLCAPQFLNLSMRGRYEVVARESCTALCWASKVKEVREMMMGVTKTFQETAVLASDESPSASIEQLDDGWAGRSHFLTAKLYSGSGSAESQSNLTDQSEEFAIPMPVKSPKRRPRTVTFH